jgi:hypothetical protein
VLLATFALYSPTLQNAFTFDDQYIAKAEYAPGWANPMVREFRPLSEYFTSHYWRGWKETAVEYRPVTILSYAVGYRLWGRQLEGTALGEAFPQHLINLLLHLLAVALTYGLLRAVRVPHWPAIGGTLVFAVHALHSEAVASVVGRAELLAFCFGSAGVLLALRGWERGRGAGVFFLAATALFFLAFCSKESALAWPGLLFVMLWVRSLSRDPSLGLPRRTLRCLQPCLATAALPMAAFLVLRANTFASLPAPGLPDPMVNPLAHLPLGERLLSAVMVYGYGLHLTLLPFELACDYGLAVFPMLASPWDPRFLGALAALALLLGAGMHALPRRPLLFLAMASFLGLSFLISNIPLVIGTIFAERLYYAPSLGLSFFVAWAAQATSARAQFRAVALAILALWVAGSSWMVVDRSLAWRNNRTLYLNDVEAQPRSVRLHYLASDLHLAEGNREAQFRHLERAFLLKPEPTRAWLRLAWFFQRQERWAEAREAAERGLASATGTDHRYRFHLQWTLAEILEKAAPQQAAPSRRAALEAYHWLMASPSERMALRVRLSENAPAVRTWLLAARFLENAGQLGEAERALREGLAAAGEAGREYRFNLHWNLVNVLDARGARRSAQGALGDALRADPAAFRQRLEAVWRLRERGWTGSELQPLLDEGRSLEPGHSEWVLYRGLLAYEMAESELALAHLDRAVRSLEAHPQLARAQQVLSLLRSDVAPTPPAPPPHRETL